MPTLLVRDLPIITVCNKCDAKLKRLPRTEWTRVFRLIEQQGGYCNDFFPLPSPRPFPPPADAGIPNFPDGLMG